MREARFFAGAALSVDGTPVSGPAGRRHPLALLAVLTAHATPEVGRDKLVDLLWPEKATGSGRHLLSEALYVLRKALGHRALHTSGDKVSLDRETVWTDVGAARHAFRNGDHRTVAELHRGPFLDGFHVSGSPRFEEWRRERAACFDAHFEESLYALADGAERWGDHREAVRWLRQRVAQDPFSSHATHRLMLALARTGDRAAAVLAARSHRRLLKEELDLSPAPCVNDLEEILTGNGDVDLDAIPRCGTPGSGCAPEASSYARKGFGTLRP